MRKILLTTIPLFSFSLTLISQSMPAQNQQLQVVRQGTIITDEYRAPYKKIASPYLRKTAKINNIDATLLGTTTYDLQTNAATIDRVLAYPDGKVSVVWTGSKSDEAGWPDRGSFYQHYDGSNWKGDTSKRVENVRTGWPILAATSTGELLISHVPDNSQTTNLDSIIFHRNSGIGSTTWGSSYGQNITGLWPRAATSGNDVVHMINSNYCGTRQVAGEEVPNCNGYTLYWKSIDGGQTWTGGNPLPNIDTANGILNMAADGYAIDATTVHDSIAATGYITVDSFSNLAGDTLLINDTMFVLGIDIDLGTDSITAADSIIKAIESNSSLNAIVSAVRNSNTIHLTALQKGGLGNEISIDYKADTTTGLTLSGANLTGGVDSLDVVAIVSGGRANDLMMWKSVDGGNSWDFNVIIDQYDSIGYSVINPDTSKFGSIGSSDILIDEKGMVHVFTGAVIFSDNDPNDNGNFFISTATNALSYWNESFGEDSTQQISAAPDYNMDGVLSGIGIDFLSYNYGGAFVTQPASTIDMSTGNIYVVFAAPIEYSDDIGDPSVEGQSRSFRNVFGIYSEDNGQTWSLPKNLTQGARAYRSDGNFEDVFPSLPRASFGEIHMIWQRDNFPGVSTNENAAHHPTGELNQILYKSFTHEDFDVSSESVTADFTFEYPGHGGRVKFTNTSSENAYTFRWSFGDNSRSGSMLEDPTFSYTANGTYEVCLTAEIQYQVIDTFLSRDSICKEVTIQSVGINDNILSNAVITYPNPTTGNYIIETNEINNNNLAVSVIDLSGKMISVSQNLVSSNKMQLDLSNLDSGIYFVQIHAGNDFITKKVHVINN